ncbi:hypothetical protein [Kitasatospora cineracea]|uniref:RecT family protein n=1 Tax=Kitasatospora cineracea TaxID=88074 RepID=A0A3N4S8G1_9ACTN|nr:hypothetical protein [Kitasatospora cineracea]RPE34970.1 hypothetical protein EDD38_3314 [Kitasatospora cineracea]
MTAEIVKAAPAASLSDMVRYAEHLAHADLLPKQFVNRPANVLYAIEYGRTLGITPIAALTGIHVIEGKPSASSGLIGALVRQAGHKLRVKGDGRSATAQIIREDDPDWTYECTWDLDRAVQAGLCQLREGKPYARDRNGKPTAWEKYPAAMLKARAITEVARDACEDVLFGLHYTPEELGAYVNQDGEPIDAPVQPLRVVQAQSARDFVAEAEAAETAEQVREVYREAAAAKEPREVVERIAAIGREKSVLTEGAAEAEVVEAEVVSDGEPDERAAAIDDLRAAAMEAGVHATIEADFLQSYGTDLDRADVAQIREMAGLLRGAA